MIDELAVLYLLNCNKAEKRRASHALTARETLALEVRLLGIARALYALKKDEASKKEVALRRLAVWKARKQVVVWDGVHGVAVIALAMLVVLAISLCLGG